MTTSSTRSPSASFTSCRRSSTTRRRERLDGNIKNTPPSVFVPSIADRESLGRIP